MCLWSRWPSRHPWLKKRPKQVTLRSSTSVLCARGPRSSRRQHPQVGLGTTLERCCRPEFLRWSSSAIRQLEELTWSSPIGHVFRVQMSQAQPAVPLGRAEKPLPISAGHAGLASNKGLTRGGSFLPSLNCKRRLCLRQKATRLQNPSF